MNSINLRRLPLSSMCYNIITHIVITGEYMKKATKRTKPGRPPTYDSPRTSIAARLQAPLHARIKAEAESAGRSISEEIERRLERSFSEQSDNLLVTIMRNTMGAEPKYVAPSHGREVGFAPSVKTMMKSRLAAFIDSLPEADESALSDEEVDELWEMLQQHKLRTRTKADRA
jgi:hypothetical protein